MNKTKITLEMLHFKGTLRHKDGKIGFVLGIDEDYVSVLEDYRYLRIWRTFNCELVNDQNHPNSIELIEAMCHRR